MPYSMPYQDIFTSRLNDLKKIADELPVAIIVHRVDTMQIVYMNSTGLKELGTSQKELERLQPEEYYLKYFNSDGTEDVVPKVMLFIKAKGAADRISYFQQVRTAHSTEWQLYVSNTRVFNRDENGDATHLLTTASGLDPVHHITAKVGRLVDEISFLRQSNLLFLTLTKREKEILALMALGFSSVEIADKLFISIATTNTHRKNIRAKLRLKNNFETVKFAQAYNLI